MFLEPSEEYQGLSFTDWLYLQRKTIERKSISVGMFLCVFVHKRKIDKKEFICRFSVFMCLFVQKTKKDKTEVDFCFSVFVFSRT